MKITPTIPLTSADEKASVLANSISFVLNISVQSIKQELEDALVNIVKSITLDELNKTIMILKGRPKTTQYLMEMYSRAEDKSKALQTVKTG